MGFSLFFFFGIWVVIRRYLDWMVGGKYLTGRHGFGSGILKGLWWRRRGGVKGER